MKFSTSITVNLNYFNQFDYISNFNRMILDAKIITDFEWSISNDLIVTCSLDGTVRVWNANSG